MMLERSFCLALGEGRECIYLRAPQLQGLFGPVHSILCLSGYSATLPYPPTCSFKATFFLGGSNN